MATHIKTDGTEDQVFPAKGKKFTLLELQTLVGGYIERVTTRDRRNMIVNEGGVILGLDPNPRARAIIDPKYFLADNMIRGNVVVCEKGEF